MILHILATGSLTADPVARTDVKGNLATATLRVATDDGTILVSIITFSTTAEILLEHKQAATLAVAGRARLSSWTGKGGAEHHGFTLAAEQIASAAAARRADAERRRGSARTGAHDE